MKTYLDRLDSGMVDAFFKLVEDMIENNGIGSIYVLERELYVM